MASTYPLLVSEVASVFVEGEVEHGSITQGTQQIVEAFEASHENGPGDDFPTEEFSVDLLQSGNFEYTSGNICPQSYGNHLCSTGIVIDRGDVQTSNLEQRIDKQ